jgi:hypothetical protein
MLFFSALGARSSILSLAHMWQFETMTRVAFEAYDALSDVDPVTKIMIYKKYGFPQENILNEYAKLCTRIKSLSIEEGRKIGHGGKTLALIAQIREVLLRQGRLSPKFTDSNIVRLMISNSFGIEFTPSCNNRAPTI